MKSTRLTNEETDKLEKDARLGALAERSSHVENVLRHAFLAQVAGEVWRDDPNEPLGISNTEVDDSGYHVLLERNAMIRRIQLKQYHEAKTPKAISVRVEFARYPGACIVAIAHSLNDLTPTSYSFFGGGPNDPMPYIEAHRTTKSPGRRKADGTRVLRLKYRDAPFSRFKKNLSIRQLIDELFTPRLGISVHA